MTAKKATKKAPPKKVAPKRLTVAQRNAEAFKMLQSIVAETEGSLYNGLCNKGKTIIKDSAKLVGSNRFTGGTATITLYEQEFEFDDLEEDDEFVIDVTVTNTRTGVSETQSDIGYNYMDIEYND